MKPIFRFSALVILIMMVALLACHRQKVDDIGPAYVSAPEGFVVKSFTLAPSTSVDFTLNDVVINAVLTSKVSWILTIKGDQSGAVYQVHGTSDSLNNIVWKGDQTEAMFFRTGENATATLSFYGTSTTATATIKILKVKDYTTCGFFPFKKFSTTSIVLTGDFENASHITPSYYWHPFNSPNPIANVDQGVGSFIVDYNGNSVPSVQGNNYYYIRGLGAQANFVSGIQYDPALGAGKHLTDTFPSDPDLVWVNIYIYGTGDANAQLDLEYQEDDATDTHSPGLYNGKDDDAFVTHITLNHKGWKLFSFQYSKLVPSSNISFGGSGNKIQEPDRLKSFDMVLSKKYDSNSPVEVYFDYPIITVGGPFVPGKCK